jgi:hypothetical protein
MHRFLLLSLACLLPLTLFAENPKTMRVDYYHSGNNEAEIFSLDRVVLEPLAFSGNLAQPIAPRWHWTLTLQAPEGWRLDGAVQASDIGNDAID